MRKTIKLNVIFFTCLIVLVGCQTAKKTPYLCQLPSGNDLGKAIEHAKSDLQRKDCQLRFDDYFMSFLEIAERSPDILHRQTFSKFISWAQVQNIISMTQAKELYSRYFARTFVSLPPDYNNCSSLQEKEDFDNLIAEMGRELRHKERGLVKICGDKAAYQVVYDQYTALLTILEATWLACDRSQ